MALLKPLHDRILVKPMQASTKTASGIYIPETAKERPQEGEVLAVGDGKILEDGKRLEVDVKEGDVVLFGKYSGVTTKMGGEEVLLLREEDILAVVIKEWEIFGLY